MTMERFERRIAATLGMAIWIQITYQIGHGIWTIGGILICAIFAAQPAVFKWVDSHMGGRGT